MINLLPSENMGKLKKEKSFRLFLLLTIYFVLFILFFSATLFALKEVSKNSLAEEREKLRETEDSFKMIERVESKTKEVNEILQPISAFYKEQIDVSKVIKETLSQMPRNSSVDSFSFELKDNKGEIKITGYAADYQALLNMEKNLKERFSSVKFNEDAWLKLNDINFSVTFKTK